MELENSLFIHKYQPLYFKDFELDEEIITIMNTLIIMNKLNIIL